MDYAGARHFEKVKKTAGGSRELFYGTGFSAEKAPYQRNVVFTQRPQGFRLLQQLVFDEAAEYPR